MFVLLILLCSVAIPKQDGALPDRVDADVVDYTFVKDAAFGKWCYLFICFLFTCLFHRFLQRLGCNGTGTYISVTWKQPRMLDS